MTIKAGALRHLVTIQHLVAGSPPQKASGEPDEAWVDLLSNVSAEWVTLRGAPLFTAQEHHSEVRGIWRMRWRDSITAKMRIAHRGLYYNILYVPPHDKDGQRNELELECAEGLIEP